MNDHERGPGAAPTPATLSGRYRIVSLLGSGGMADVYLAEDETLGRPVAVKVLKERLAADAEFVERFRIEAQAAASLNHPNIVAVYDRGTAEGATFIAMEYVRGESLKQRLRRDGALAPDDAVAIALAVLSALEAAHRCEIVHRDVTSYNVLLDETGRVKVADFGIARVGSSALTRTGAMLGTSSYLSPEQAQGRTADGRSDLYSLGVVLWEMLTGGVPFRGENDLAVAMQHVSAAPPNPRSLQPGVPEALAGVVMRALSKDPDDRYQTAAEFAEALRAVRRGPRPERGDEAAAVVVPPLAAAASSSGAAASSPGAAAPPSRAAVPTPHPARPPASQPGRSGGPVVPRDASAPPRTAVAADAPTRYRAPRGAAAAGRPRRRRRRRLVLLAAVIAIAAIGVWALYALVIAGSEVPRVVGSSRADAVEAVRDEGLRPEVHYVWADRYAAGDVARQSPRGGTEVEDGVKVDLWVSRGPLHIPAPDLSGIAASVARGRLAGESLNGRSRRAASEDTPKGQIFKQKPAAGETVARGDTVTFWVSSGPPVIDVPDVVGLSQGKAAAVLEEAGFVVDTDLVVGFGEFPGDVVAQDPAAGTRARAGDEVVIEVAVF